MGSSQYLGDLEYLRRGDTEERLPRDQDRERRQDLERLPRDTVRPRDRERLLRYGDPDLDLRRPGDPWNRPCERERLPGDRALLSDEPRRRSEPLGERLRFLPGEREYLFGDGDRPLTDFFLGDNDLLPGERDPFLSGDLDPFLLSGDLERLGSGEAGRLLGGDWAGGGARSESLRRLPSREGERLELLELLERLRDLRKEHNCHNARWE